MPPISAKAAYDYWYLIIYTLFFSYSLGFVLTSFFPFSDPKTIPTNYPVQTSVGPQ